MLGYHFNLQGGIWLQLDLPRFALVNDGHSVTIKCLNLQLPIYRNRTRCNVDRSSCWEADFPIASESHFGSELNLF